MASGVLLCRLERTLWGGKAGAGSLRAKRQTLGSSGPTVCIQELALRIPKPALTAGLCLWLQRAERTRSLMASGSLPACRRAMDPWMQ